ncbi:MAG: crossover junction endodeoxyribonuclease RuvC [Minisyncoccia bacterium]
MIIIGIDPGTTRIGWAVIKTRKKEVKPLNYGCWELKEKEQGARLLKIFHNLNKLIKDYSPDYLIIERVFFFKNAKTVMSISEAVGVISLTAQKNKLKCHYLTPLEVKQILIGYGRAEKKEIQKFVQMIFSLKEIPKPDDTSDALAVAIAGFHKLNHLKNTVLIKKK